MTEDFALFDFSLFLHSVSTIFPIAVSLTSPYLLRSDISCNAFTQGGGSEAKDFKKVWQTELIPASHNLTSFFPVSPSYLLVRCVSVSVV